MNPASKMTSSEPVLGQNGSPSHHHHIIDFHQGGGWGLEEEKKKLGLEQSIKNQHWEPVPCSHLCVKVRFIHLLPSKTDLTGAALDIGVPFSTPFGCAHRRFSQKAVRMVHTNPAPKMTSADQCWNKMANQGIMK